MSRTIDYELDDENDIVDAIRGSRVSRLFVEFLQQGGPKPHVVLGLDINPTVELEGDTWMGCRLAMDLAGGYDGVVHITPLPYNTASHAAHAAFEFKLNLHWTVENIISTISQPTANLDVVRGRTGFHQIIGYNYKSASKSTVVEDLPLARGTFSSPTFRRTVIYHTSDNRQYILPYNPATLQSGDEGFDTPTYKPQSAGTSQDSTYRYNPQQTIAEGSTSSVQKTYPPEWKWSEEHKSWWRLDSDGQYEWHSNASQETSAGEPSTSHNAVG